MINKFSKIPLYSQLVDILIKKIETEMQPNDKMPSERDICQIYSVSRTTVRLAMSELETAGYIYKRHGKGTFVSSLNKDKQNLMDSYSFTDQMRQNGKVPQTKVLAFEIIESNHFVAGQMGLEVPEKVIRFVRLRLADHVPMMVETTYIPYGDFSGLTEEELSHKPLYDIFKERYGEYVEVAEEQFSAGLVKEKEADLLGIDKGDACLNLKRLSYDQFNRVIEFTLSVARSDQFIYKVRHLRQ